MSPRALAALTLLAVACGVGKDAPPAEQTTLPPGVVARVADEDIPQELVERIARAQRIDARAARELAIADALFAVHARNVLAGTGLVESAERAALARVLLEDIRREAEALGRPTDAEVEEVTELHWIDFARPRLSRTTQAVVLDPGATKSEKARKLAETLRDSVRGETDPAAFEKKAKALATDGLTLKVENLLPVAADGRVADPKAPPGAPPARLEKEYAAAADAIPTVGAQSDIIETRHGLHVILLVDRIPEQRVSLDERRVVLEREIIDRRAKKRHLELLQSVNASTPVLLDRAANDLLSRVQVGR